MRSDRVGATSSPTSRGPLVLLSLCVVPVGLWTLSAPLADRFDGSYRSLTSIAVAARLRRHGRVRAQPRARRAAAPRRRPLRRSRPDVPRASLERPARLRPPPGARRPPARGAGDALCGERARAPRAGCGVDSLRRRARVLGSDGRSRAHPLRAARARGVRVRPTLVRGRLPPRRLPRARDEEGQHTTRARSPSTSPCSRASGWQRSPTARCSAPSSCGGGATGSSP